MSINNIIPYYPNLGDTITSMIESLSLEKPMDDRLYDLREVLRRYPVSRAQWYKGMKEGRYPSGEKRGGRRFWHPKEISRLIRRGEGV